VATAISFITTPIIQHIGQKLNILDYLSERKIHKKPVPRLGGIPIFMAFNLSVLLGILFKVEFLDEFLSRKWISFLIAQCIVLGIGLYDDIKKLKPGTKFIFQIFAGALLVVSGFGIQIVTNPLNGNPLHLGFLFPLVTILWLVGITNALNLIDGIDGLASGTAFIVSATIFGISFLNQNIGIALLSLIVAGSVLGFLKYNFHPAKIFLGDSGSMLLGFWLAVLSIEGASKGATFIVILAPILALGLPIIDTFISMARRFLKSINLVDYPVQKKKLRILFFKGFTMFEADKDHVHHRLLRLGLSQEKAVLILYGANVVLCGLAFLVIVFKSLNTALFIGVVFTAFLIGIKNLNYREFKVLENGLFIPIFDVNVINKRIFQAIFDLFLISFSYYLSFILVFSGFGGEVKGVFIQTIPVVLAIKLIIFYFSSIYKGSWRYSSVGDLIKIIKAGVISSIVSALFLIIFFGVKSFGGVVFFLLDFYVLLSLVAGSRISYRVFDYYYHKNSKEEGRKIIVYGAGRRGALLVKELHYNGDLRPVGFIDDDLRKRGKIQYDVPILGTLKDLDKVIQRYKVSEIVLSTKKISREKISFLKNLCKENGICLRLFDLKMDKVV